MTNLILDEREMREEFVAVYNKWIQQMPAFIMVPILEKLSDQASKAAEIQYQQELKKQQESEVEDDGREEDN